MICVSFQKMRAENIENQGQCGKIAALFAPGSHLTDTERAANMQQRSPAQVGAAA
jgi:hypothetical protein